MVVMVFKGGQMIAEGMELFLRNGEVYTVDSTLSCLKSCTVHDALRFEEEGVLLYTETPQ